VNTFWLMGPMRRRSSPKRSVPPSSNTSIATSVHCPRLVPASRGPGGPRPTGRCCGFRWVRMALWGAYFPFGRRAIYVRAMTTQPAPSTAPRRLGAGPDVFPRPR
jgi:hypothetical protein